MFITDYTEFIRYCCAIKPVLLEILTAIFETVVCVFCCIELGECVYISISGAAGCGVNVFMESCDDQVSWYRTVSL